jgi:chromosome segregation ATPase
MTGEKRKILLLDYDSKVTKAAKKSLDKQYDISLAKTVKDAHQIALSDNFDIIITGYIVPAVSSEKALLCLKHLDTTVSKYEESFRNKKAETKKLVQQSEETKTEILKFLNEKLRTVISEKSSLKKEFKIQEQLIDRFQKEISGKEKELNKKNDIENQLRRSEEENKTAIDRLNIALADMKSELDKSTKISEGAKSAKEEMEKEIKNECKKKEDLQEKIIRIENENKKNGEKLNNKIKLMKNERDSAANIAEMALAEKDKLHEKLTTFQENWDYLVNGN